MYHVMTIVNIAEVKKKKERKETTWEQSSPHHLCTPFLLGQKGIWVLHLSMSLFP